MSAGDHTKGSLVVGLYRPSERFLAVREHVAVMKLTGELVALTGSNDNDETPSSKADAKLFCAANKMLELLERLARPDDVADAVRARVEARELLVTIRGGA